MDQETKDVYQMVKELIAHGGSEFEDTISAFDLESKLVQEPPLPLLEITILNWLVRNNFRMAATLYADSAGLLEELAEIRGFDPNDPNLQLAGLNQILEQIPGFVSPPPPPPPLVAEPGHPQPAPPLFPRPPRHPLPTLPHDGFHWKRYRCRLVQELGPVLMKHYYKCTYPYCKVRKVYWTRPDTGEGYEAPVSGRDDHGHEKTQH